MRVRTWLAIAPFALLFSVSLCRAAGTVAVLPLFNLNEITAPDLDWIGESVAETIHESLHSAGLLLLERDERTEVYRRLSVRTGVVLTKATVMKIGETLDAGQVIYGEFQADGSPATPKSTLHLVARVIDLSKRRAGAQVSQTGPLEDLSKMETTLAWMLAKELAPESAPGQEEFMRDRPPVRVDAMESYIRGLMSANADQRMKLFNQALQLEPQFSQPSFQLGRMLFAKNDYKGAEQAFARVTKGDSHYLEAIFFRAICDYYQNDFDGAINRFRTVAGEVPLNEVYNDLGAALSRRNDPAATENFRKALEGDEGDPDYWFNFGYSLWKTGQFAQAAEKFRAVLDRTPNDQEATIMLGKCLKSDGPKSGDPRSDGRQRIKISFEDSAWRQLKAELRDSSK